MEKKQTERGFKAIACGATLGACELSSQWLPATQLLARCAAEMLRLDVLCFNMALGACEKSYQWREALGIFAALDAPSASSVNGAVAALASTAWRQALELLPAEANALSYGACIGACVKAVQWQLALGLFQELRAAASAVDLVTRSLVLGAYQQAMYQGTAPLAFLRRGIIMGRVGSCIACSETAELAHLWLCAGSAGLRQAPLALQLQLLDAMLRGASEELLLSSELRGAVDEFLVQRMDLDFSALGHIGS
ncbi:unnamed protein product [Effrenium voratum]|nr:unnamed protein product [Effrenium voratum]